MSLLATITLACAGVYAFLGIFYCVLYARRREGMEYLTFGLFAGCMAVYAVGAALLTDATTEAAGLQAEELQFASAIPAIAFYLHFMSAIVWRRAAKWIVAAYAFAFTAPVVAALHMAFSHASSAVPKTWGFDSAPIYPEHQLSVLGTSYVVFWLLGMCFSIVQFWRHRQVDRDTRVLAFAGAAIVAAAVHDQIVLSSAFRSIYLLEHGGMIANMAVGWVLLGRFARTSDELVRRTSELQRSYTYLRHTQEELVAKEQLASVGELSAVIAHEVQSPIAIIKSAVSTLQKPRISEGDRSGMLDILDEETDRLNRIVNNLLAFARPVQPHRRTVEVAALVHHALDIATSVRSVEHITVRDELAGRTDAIECDPDLLRQGLVNIIDNAIQAMPDGGALVLRANAEKINGQDMMTIHIADTGEGMDPLVRDRARDPFFTTRPTGTGLGLAIVERVVKAHGGSVQIESIHGKGTRVTITLPRDRASLQPPTPVPTPEPDATAFPTST